MSVFYNRGGWTAQDPCGHVKGPAEKIIDTAIQWLGLPTTPEMARTIREAMGTAVLDQDGSLP